MPSHVNTSRADGIDLDIFSRDDTTTAKSARSCSLEIRLQFVHASKVISEVLPRAIICRLSGGKNEAETSDLTNHHKGLSAYLKLFPLRTACGDVDDFNRESGR